MNEGVSPTEQSAEQAVTSAPTPPPVQEEKNNGYKPVTLRARKNTQWFFDRIEKIQREHGLGTADASERVINELLQEQGSTGEQAAEIENLKTRLAELEEENKKLLVLTETPQSAEPALQDNEHIIVIEQRFLQTLNTIAAKRFAHPRTRERYKLSAQESAGELMLNCIMTQDILFDYNNCFYTGLTREMYEQYKQGRTA